MYQLFMYTCVVIRILCSVPQYYRVYMYQLLQYRELIKAINDQCKLGIILLYFVFVRVST